MCYVKKWSGLIENTNPPQNKANLKIFTQSFVSLFWNKRIYIWLVCAACVCTLTLNVWKPTKEKLALSRSKCFATKQSLKQIRKYSSWNLWSFTHHSLRADKGRETCAKKENKKKEKVRDKTNRFPSERTSSFYPETNNSMLANKLPSDRCCTVLFQACTCKLSIFKNQIRWL